MTIFNDLIAYEKPINENKLALSDVETNFILECIKNSQRKRLYFIKKQNGIKEIQPIKGNDNADGSAFCGRGSCE